ncbi:amino acid ABC transporter ATP-binding protein [Brachybacterium saurashtrense]|uniref:Amino acid ABC transporter ATP-binding protein n=1 Tax=Brachybacterium saurashtrense TaxID=556288 RepID=A0A345YSC9_9MICO|nr:amino acid ABC transporter ATP-binding protein [Brachybacterium saurashtrense]AXK46831.1 amino acid ABC transporter ATP-binding protein [Brachybacterium saurashtrense]RRR22546.1 amino acid ABC transporter ATP-binding protein [Brachybacterium saurashtrense]
MSALTALLHRSRRPAGPAARPAPGAGTAAGTATAPEGSGPAPADAPARGGLVEIRAVRKSFGDLEVLRGIDLRVEPGEVTAVLGPSGSGKSTLLRTINHLETIDAGLITVDGEVIGYRREGNLLHELHEHEVLRQRTAIGMVFQSFNLFAHMTALANVAEAPRRALGVPRRQAEARARELLELVGLADKAAVYPRQLSGGQQQRVAIARALALRPKVLLFDEPTSALDPELVEEVLAVIRSLARAGTTLVIVTHEISFARDVADTVVFMDQGQIVEQGPPGEVLDAPRHPRTRAFLQRVRPEESPAGHTAGASAHNSTHPQPEDRT